MTNIFHTLELEELVEFSERQEQLGLLSRTAPTEAECFFRQFTSNSFYVAGEVTKRNPYEDIQYILEDTFPKKIQQEAFYHTWLTDMAKISQIFCDIQKANSICFWLGSQRGCRRYHVDNVPLRLLVTYTGKGTEWIPDDAANREAFTQGASNEQIIQNPSAIQFMNPWDIAIFRGGQDGLLHRTPDAAMNNPSILLRLDSISFWENILQYQ